MAAEFPALAGRFSLETGNAIAVDMTIGKMRQAVTLNFILIDIV
jgi:hypothetical protein